MEKKNFRGLLKNQEVNNAARLRNIKPLSERFKDFLLLQNGVIIIGGMLLGCVFIYPSVAELWAILAFVLFFWASKQPYRLPFRMGVTSNLEDPSEGTLSKDERKKLKAKYKKAAGITYFGNDISTGEELWFNDSDLRTHLLIFGSTGSGKTETLISIAYNCLVQGSGFIYVDGKGDNTLFAKLFSICRSLGREDDLLVINYMTGGRDVFGPQKTRISNTLNPFVSGSAAGLTELLVSLMDESGGDGAMWKGRAISLISGIMFALVYQRDFLGLLLDVDVIRDHLVLDNIQKLAKRKDIPQEFLKSIRNYLRSLPGYQENAPGGKQSETVADQHGYLQMQFTRILGSLSDTYGYIFRTNLGEVDFYDVVANRRILVVLLPALEKSPDELANLGKIIVSCLKQMMAVSLGDKLEGSWEKVIETKPTLTESPFLCILDEYGYYVVKGAAVMPAQARSLGFSMCFAGQDYPSFKKNNNSEEAIATIGNCNIKICMKIEDPTETFDLFDKSAAEAYTAVTGGYQGDTDGVFLSYMDQRSANVQSVKRLNLLDLRDQDPGEAHILFKSTIVRAKMFYAQPPKTKHLRLNYFLRVEPPEKDAMIEQDESLRNLGQNLCNDELVQDHIEDIRVDSKLSIALRAIQELRKDIRSPAHLVFAGLSASLESARKQKEQYIEASNKAQSFADEEEDEGAMNIYGSDVNESSFEDEHYKKLKEQMKSRSGYSNSEDPFINESGMRQSLEDMERRSGASSAEAAQRSKLTLDEMRLMTAYPRVKPSPVSSESVLDIIKEISEDVESGEETETSGNSGKNSGRF